MIIDNRIYIGDPPSSVVRHPRHDPKGKYLWQCGKCSRAYTTLDMIDLTEEREGFLTHMNEAKFVCPNEDCMMSDDGNNWMKIDD